MTTYKQAEEKIFDAYFKDEIKIFEPEFCFCGTLSGNNRDWINVIYNEDNSYPYCYEEYGKMEKALFSQFTQIYWCDNGQVGGLDDDEEIEDIFERKDFEDKLFKGMCAALEVLKNIHRDRGEIIDEEPVFIKRTLFQNI